MITVTVLTKKQDGAGHHSTEVTIDFSKISQEQLLLLARARIVERWIHGVSYSKEPVPSEVLLRAEDFVQPDTVYIDKPLNLPKRKDPSVEKLLSGLSIKDRQEMLTLLEGL